MTPNMGQGACQAIEDAVALQAALQAAVDLSSALVHYQEKRLAHTSRVIRQSRSIGRMGQIANPLLIKLRDAAMQLMPAELALQQLEAVLAERV